MYIVYIASSITSQKAVMQAFSIIDCPVEPHLLVLVVNFFCAKHPSHVCVKTAVSYGKANMVYGRKAMIILHALHKYKQHMY